MNEKIKKIYEKYKVLKEESKKDCTFDKSHMELQFDNSYTIIKWINYKSEWNQIYRVYETKRKEIYRKLYLHYKLESDLKISTVAELQLFIESDLQYTGIFEICQMIKEILQFISEVVETLKGKNFEIQRWQRHLEFINGK